MASFSDVTFAVASTRERAGAVLEIDTELRMTKDAWRTLSTLISQVNVRPVPGGNKVVIQLGHGPGEADLDLGDGERLRAFLTKAEARLSNSQGEMTVSCTFLVPREPQ